MGTYLSGHRRQIPNTANNGPAGHHSQQVRHHPIFAAVPEGITELRVVLKNNGKLDDKTLVVLIISASPGTVIGIRKLFPNPLHEHCLSNATTCGQL